MFRNKHPCSLPKLQKNENGILPGLDITQARRLPSINSCLNQSRSVRKSTCLDLIRPSEGEVDSASAFGRLFHGLRILTANHLHLSSSLNSASFNFQPLDPSPARRKSPRLSHLCSPSRYLQPGISRLLTFIKQDCAKGCRERLLY